jgi:hypothetical protein
VAELAECAPPSACAGQGTPAFSGGGRASGLVPLAPATLSTPPARAPLGKLLGAGTGAPRRTALGALHDLSDPEVLLEVPLAPQVRAAPGCLKRLLPGPPRAIVVLPALVASRFAVLAPS